MMSIPLQSSLRLCPIENNFKLRILSNNALTLDDSSFATTLRGRIFQLSECTELNLEPVLPDNMLITPYICYTKILQFQQIDENCSGKVQLILIDGDSSCYSANGSSHYLLMRSHFLIPRASAGALATVIVDDATSILLCDDCNGGHFLPHYSTIGNDGYKLKVPLQRHVINDSPVMNIFSLVHKSLVDFILDRIMSSFSNPVISNSNDESISEGRVMHALIVGRSGSGCTSVVVEVCRSLHLPFILITAGSVYSASYRGHASSTTPFSGSGSVQSTSKLFYSFPANNTNHPPAQFVYTAFMYAVAMAPCVLVFDDIHRLCAATDEDSARILEAILCCLRTLHSIQGEKRVFTAFISTSEKAVPESLRKVLTEKIVVPDSYPTLGDREKLANNLCDSLSAREGEAVSLARRAVVLLHNTEVLSFATTLKQQAPLPFIHRLIRFLQECSGSASKAEDVENSSTCTPVGASMLTPSVAASPPSAMFSEIAGMKEVKQTLVEVILWPRKYPDIFMRYGIRAAGSGLLLFGPPGTGKTLIPQVVARELNCSLLVMKLSEVVVGEVGGGEKKIAQLFADARKSAPSIVFIDEFQALFMKGLSTMSAALAGCFDDVANWNSCMGAERLVTVIASTNEPWAIGSGFLRPGRLGRAIFLGPLDAEGRRVFMADQLKAQFMRVCNHTTGTDYFDSDHWEEKLIAHVGLGHVVTATEGFTGADMQRLITLANKTLLSALEEASSIPVSSDFDQLLQVSVPCAEHFQVAMTQVKPSVTAQEMEEYLSWQKSRRFNH